MNETLNQRAWALAQASASQARELGLRIKRAANGALLLDFGAEAPGSVEAGLALARLCLAGLGEVKHESDPAGARVTVRIDAPWLPCLASQFAGWKLEAGKFLAMGSGPMRAVAAHEPLFARLVYTELAEAVVGILECRQSPPLAIIEQVAQRCRVAPTQIILAYAPTASLAGIIQIGARSVETALHKLFELGFDVKRIIRGSGSAPLPPIGATDFLAMGLTNDAILYGSEVTLWTDLSDDDVSAIGPRVPSCSSAAHGRPFRELFAEAGGDFYKLDPMLFSPAVVTFRNVKTDGRQRFGRLEPEILKRSFAGSSG